MNGKLAVELLFAIDGGRPNTPSGSREKEGLLMDQRKDILAEVRQICFNSYRRGLSDPRSSSDRCVPAWGKDREENDRVLPLLYPWGQRGALFIHQ